MRILGIVFLVVGLAFATTTSMAPKDIEVRATNNLGTLIAQMIVDFLTCLGDPFVVIKELSIPVDVLIPVNGTEITLKGNFNVSDLEVKGLSSLVFTDSVAKVIPKIQASFGFHLPELVITANYAVAGEVTIPDLPFPLPRLDGDGPFALRISGIQFDTDLNLKIKPDLKIELSELAYGIDIYQIWIDIEGLFKEMDKSGNLNEAVKMVLNPFATPVVNMFEANLHDNITLLSKFVVNEVLGNMTLSDLLDLINGGWNPCAPATDAPINLVY